MDEAEGVASKVAVNVPVWEAMAVFCHVAPAVTQTGAIGFTTNVTPAVCVRLPLVPVIVREKVPATVEAEVEMLKVELPEPVTEVGLKAPEAPAGSPLTVKVTLPLKLLTGLTLAV